MDPTNVQNPNTHNGRTQPVHKIIQVHKVDGHQGSRPRSTECTDPTRVATIMKVHDVDGSSKANIKATRRIIHYNHQQNIKRSI